jgi:sarcosine oxidase subunit beta
MKRDVVIIGGGIVGCAAAYYLAKQGIKATVLEKNAGVGLEASGCNGGGVRQHGRKSLLPMAMASVRLWENLREELGSDLEYVQTGNINVAIDDSLTEALEQEVVWEKSHGLNDVRMLTAKECHEIVPGMTSQVVSGKICSTDGVANPMLVSPAFAKAAIKLGAEFKVNTKVVSLLQQGNRVCGVHTEKGEIEAELVLNAAGPWASQLSAQAGCFMPVHPGLSQLVITERLSQNPLKLWVTVKGQGYMRPTLANNIVLGTSGARNDEYSHHADYRKIQAQSERWSKLFSWLKEVRILRVCAGITEYTPDASPYIGVVPGVDGFLVAAGYGGEGFCTGPAVGKTMAELIAGKETEVSLEPFRPERFSEAIKSGKPIPQVVYPFDKMFKLPVFG